MVLFDTSIVVLVLQPDALAPTDPLTGRPVTRCKDRVEHLIKTCSAAKSTILIPTPVLAEFLVKAGPKKQDYLNRFTSSKNFQIATFDQRAAVELSLLTDPDLQSGKPMSEMVTKAKIKFDRQIVAIAKVSGVDMIYTGDDGLASCARKNGIRASMTWEIPLPPDDPQQGLFNGEEVPETKP